MTIFGKSAESTVRVLPPSISTANLLQGGTPVAEFNLVVSLYRAQADAATRALYEEIFGHWANAIRELSNSRMRLNSVTVFLAGVNAGVADVVWLQSGTPKAPVNGFQTFLSIEFCDVFVNACPSSSAQYQCTGSDLNLLGNLATGDVPIHRRVAGWVLAHEFAHYVLGLYDEYLGSCTPPGPGCPEFRPQAGDIEVNSLMGNVFKVFGLNGNLRLEWGNLSTALHPPYDGTAGTTVQKRIYNFSAWDLLSNQTLGFVDATQTTRPGRTGFTELIGASPAVHPAAVNDRFVFDFGDGVTSVIPPPPPAPITVNWRQDRIHSEVVLDRSGSMAILMGLDQAKEAAKNLIEAATPSKTSLGVLAFDQGVTEVQTVKRIDIQSDKDPILAKVDLISLGGLTAIFDAAKMALEKLQACEAAGVDCDPSATRLVFLLTDGMDNSSVMATADSVIQQYQGQGSLNVFAYGLFNSASTLPTLQRLATETGGQFRATPRKFTEIQEALLAAQAATTSAVGVIQTGSPVPMLGSRTFSFAVDSTLDEMGVFVGYRGCPGELELSLSGPLGAVPVTFTCRDFGCSNPDPNLGTSNCSTFLDPSMLALGGVGTWSLVVTNLAERRVPVSVNVVAAPDSGPTFDLAVQSVGGTSIQFPEPILVTATVSSGFPITGVEIVAVLTDPEGVQSTFEMRDDGTHGDPTAGDGVYSAIIDYAQDGPYTIEVSVFNPGLSAEFSAAGFVFCPALSPNLDGTVPEQVAMPPILEDFTRTASTQVLVSGVVADDHPDFAPGTALVTDGFSMPGKINFAGDPDVFTVPTNGLEFLTLRVSDLAFGMEPRLRILAEDGTELASVTRADLPPDFGYVSVTLHTGGNSVLHAVVEHDLGATGSYRISAGTQMLSDAPYMTKVDIRPGSCPNILNRKSNGIVKVALVGTDVFRMPEVEIASCELMRTDLIGAPVAPNEGPPGPSSKVKDVATPFAGTPCDCNDAGVDGLLDIELSFRTEDLVDQLGLDELPESAASAMLTLRGTRTDGLRFQADDCVQFVPPVDRSAAAQCTVIVKSTQEGAWIEASVPDAWLDEGGFTPFELTYRPSTVLTLTAEPSHLGKAFLGWSVVAGVERRYTTRELKLTVPPEGASILAIFEK